MTKIRVRYAETDKMGVVYHANYLVWFEIGRTDHLKEIGINYRELEEMGIMVPVLEVSCKYIQPARYDDLITVDTVISEVGKAKFKFKYEIKRDIDGALLVRGETTHLFVDKNFKPLNLKKQNPEIWEKLNS